MMDCETVLRSRRSHRRFATEIPSTQTITALVERAAWAPSAGNRQDWHFRVIRSHETITAINAAVTQAWTDIADASGGIGEEIAAYAGNFSWLSQAPVLIVVSVKSPPAWLQAACGARAPRIAGGQTSAALAMQNLVLAAEDRGLATCICTAPIAAEESLRSLLLIPRRQELVGLIALGFPLNTPPIPPRKPLELEFDI